MQITICGSRGSTPAPGAAFVRYGGQTSCVAVARDGEAPALLLDGGTGLRTLARMMNGSPFRGTMLIGHLHWDHTHGIPFFRAGDQPGARVDVRIPAQGDAAEVMARALGPPHFPVRIDELRGDWSLDGIEPGAYEFDGFEVLAREIPHKRTRTFGFRISDGSASIAYLSDHAPQNLGGGPDGYGEYHEAALQLAAGVDLLIHDAQYTPDEFEQRADFGHTTPQYAIGLAKAAGARGVLLFHHDPDRTDDDLDAMMAGFNEEGITITAAVEGAVLNLPRA